MIVFVDYLSGAFSVGSNQLSDVASTYLINITIPSFTTTSFVIIFFPLILITLAANVLNMYPTFFITDVLHFNFSSNNPIGQIEIFVRMKTSIYLL